MQHRFVTLSMIFVVSLLVCAPLSSCGRRDEEHPAASLQRLLNSRLADPGICPGGSSQDIQSVIDAAGSDRVAYLPEGCYRIEETVNLPSCISLIGAGADKTILYRYPGGSYSKPMLHLRGGVGEACTTQVTGLSLLGVRDTEDTGQDYGLVISGVKDFRVDHAYFEGFGFAGVRVEGNSRGVIDHTIFLDNYKRGIDNLGYGVVVYGYAWDPDPHPGDDEAIFIEDSLFVGNRHAIAASAGAHYVFRHNQVLGGVEACAVDAHGMGYGSPHGTRYVEIYNNLASDPVYDWCGIGIRGGSGVIFENTIQGYQNPILLILEWGTPDKYKAEYPALDQVQELYVWDNHSNGRLIQPRVDETGESFIEAGRDFFTEEKPGYVPYDYPHPLAGGGPYDPYPWPPETSPAVEPALALPISASPSPSASPMAFTPTQTALYCTPTMDDGLSPSYKPNAPNRSSVGQGHVLEGVVLSSRDCTPIANAQIELWPEYDGQGHPDEARATIFTDKAGRYHFECDPPEHIHMRISADGYQTLAQNSYHPDGQPEGRFDIVLVPVSP